uniref:BHLH domain-containing protein n=1 Tax=Hemiselmis andersenii TaxID=464988 RepID=A0A6U2BL29_HEMAN|mmetsp:Transcript_16020/g.36980  ORF Transcript_16020/g.36980 Transcript_16020/m.36980 type:complete len:439 (-) Transcript_16020:181-1497(-)|eukprot:CAMPEP_0114135452 /NCGR_PEP_ID=MMETSP0043_2-20121206/14703_1 /TAXON_ID=464988 /ORGANISM="Hemiselmis andersenii, Strain CCMP644" /LENGTH=438 /DNA_ID=CAMNT_0001229169 /DNA_START=238 /DNA_END=1554 /DNA_ORIENTATION=-
MCRCVDKPRAGPVSAAAGAQPAQGPPFAAKTHPDLGGAGWRNPFNPSEAFGDAFDFWCPSSTGALTTSSPSESNYTSASQAATPLQNEETEEWPEATKTTFEPSLFDGFAPDAFFRELATSLANDEAELVPAATAEVVAPAPAPAAPCHSFAPVADFAPAVCHAQASAIYIQQAPVQALDVYYTQELLFPAPHPISEAQRFAPAPAPKKAPVHKAAAVKTEGALAAEGDSKLCKWKRRDIAKHLAGERSRRAKRMGKVHTLQALVEGLPHKPTVNQILAGAIAQIKQAKAEGKVPEPAVGVKKAAEAEGLSFRDGFRMSGYVKTMVLDENHCVLEASPAMLQALQWPGAECTIRGQYIASVMHPEDACALVGEAHKFRSSGLGEGNVQAVRTVASFMGFVPMAGMGDGGGCLAFPRGYMPQAVVDVTISNKMMFVCVP